MVREYNDAVELGQPKRPIIPWNQERHVGPRSRGVQMDRSLRLTDARFGARGSANSLLLGPAWWNLSTRVLQASEKGEGAWRGRGPERNAVLIPFSRRFRTSRRQAGLRTWVKSGTGSPVFGGERSNGYPAEIQRREQQGRSDIRRDGVKRGALAWEGRQQKETRENVLSRRIAKRKTGAHQAHHSSKRPKASTALTRSSRRHGCSGIFPAPPHIKGSCTLASCGVVWLTNNSCCLH
jgi:hypothetical protein